MPPRLRPLLANCAARLASKGERPSLPFRPFTSSSIHLGKKQDRLDRYTQSLKDAHNLASSSRLKAAEEANDDPIRGITTPFAKSLEEPLRKPDVEPTSTQALNYSISIAELEQQLRTSKHLSTPMDTPEVATLVHELTPEEIQQARNEAAQKNEETHSHAEEALKRIFKVEHGNAQDRFKYNVKRCIDTFGRHNTDSVLLSKSGEAIEDKFRAGPDTGSSEVQIAVLTARIRKLANFLDTRGRKDIANKRSLRLLVHKRQKLLQYLRRKERGGPRWQNCISTLGLTEATWKGEITI